MLKSYKVDKCPECESTDIITDIHHGEIYCEHCGLVIEERMIDYGPEYREFEDDAEPKKRNGPKTTLARHDRGLMTHFVVSKKDSYGGRLSKSNMRMMYRMAYAERISRTRNSTERNYVVAFTYLNKLCDAFSFNDAVKERSSYMYRQCVDKEVVKGRPIHLVMLVCVYITMREYGMPRTFNEIYDKVKEFTNTKLTEKKFARAYNYVRNLLDISLRTTDADDYIDRFGSKLELPRDVIVSARNISSLVHGDRSISGKNPIGIAGGIIRVAGEIEEYDVPISDISRIVDITEVTIRTRAKDIVGILDKKSNEQNI